MKTAAWNKHMVVERKEGRMSLTDRLEKYITGSSEAAAGGSVVVSGGSIYAACRAIKG